MALYVLPGTYEAPKNVVDVGLGDFYSSDNLVCTTGVGPCIGLVAVRENYGLVGHFPDLTTIENFQKRFLEAINASRIFKANSYWLLGGRPLIRDGVDIVEDDRLFAIEQIRENMRPGDKLQTRWTKEGKAIDIVMNPKRNNAATVYEHDARLGLFNF